MPPPIQIMLVDDEPLVIFALQEIIEHDPQLTVIATASDAHDALSQLRHIRPDIVILDLQMPHMHGIECLKYIRIHYPDIIVMLLSTFDDDQYIVEGFLHGARSYLLKKHSIDHLTAYIHDAMNNTFVMPATLAHKLAGILQHKTISSIKTIDPAFFQSHGLSRVEQQIVQLLVQRLSNKEIANQLHVHIGTVKNHLVMIYTKLDTSNRSDTITLIEQHLL